MMLVAIFDVLESESCLVRPGDSNTHSSCQLTYSVFRESCNSDAVSLINMDINLGGVKLDVNTKAEYTKID